MLTSKHKLFRRISNPNPINYPSLGRTKPIQSCYICPSLINRLKRPSFKPYTCMNQWGTEQYYDMPIVGTSKQRAHTYIHKYFYTEYESILFIDHYHSSAALPAPHNVLFVEYWENTLAMKCNMHWGSHH